jgi:hypothetical protein
MHNEEYGFQLEYPSSWKINNKIQPAVSPEVAKMFNNDINPGVYPEFTQFRILQLKPDIESDGYESSFVGNPVFSLSIYLNNCFINNKSRYSLPFVNLREPNLCIPFHTDM